MSDYQKQVSFLSFCNRIQPYIISILEEY